MPVRSNVIDESDDYIVVDKPPFLLTHPTKPGQNKTLWQELRELLAFEIENGGQISIVNRLDRETSGLVLVAKTAAAARRFGLLMQQQRFHKEYLAIVCGWPEWETKIVDAPLDRQEKHQPSAIWLKQTIHPAGARSRTEFRVEQRFTRSDARLNFAEPSPQLYLDCGPQRSPATLAAAPAMSRSPTAPFSPLGRGGKKNLRRSHSSSPSAREGEGNLLPPTFSSPSAEKGKRDQQRPVFSSPSGRGSHEATGEGSHTEKFALVRAIPRTGRTHQIRVHLASSGYPIVGDKIYGPNENLYLKFIQTGWSEGLERDLLLPRHALHSTKLSIAGKYEWTSALPDDLRAFLDSAL